MAGTEATTGPDGVLQMPARDIPVPGHISETARAFLSAERLPAPTYPALDDAASWRKVVKAQNGNFAKLAGPRLEAAARRCEKRVIAGADVYIAEPLKGARQGKLCISFHGGALLFYGGELVVVDAARTADQTGCICWSVDYAMPPDHPYPAGLDQAVAVYREALKAYAPEDIVLAGVSAGGCIAAATALKTRDQDLPVPAAIVLRTPELDLTESGDSFSTIMGIDGVLPRSLMNFNLLYAGGADLKHPYLSPLFGDFGEGFPRAFLQAGTRDLFLSNTTRMHRALRKAGIWAEHHLWEAMPHAGFGGISPEDEEVGEAIHDFVTRMLARP